jgi:predicted permease
MSPAEQPDGSVRAVRARVRSRLAEEARDSRTTVNVLACAVALILLIACVNVAGLVLARGAARQPELALRAALGAARTRLVRQLLTESAVLALAGGGLGVLFASVSLDTIVAILPLTLPADSSPALNVGVLAASVALLIPTTVLFGLAPAIRLSRASLVAELGRAGRQPGTALSRRGGQVLIATEVALAVILVAGAGLMLRSFARMYAVDLGFKPGGLVMMEVLPLDADPAVHQAYYTELVRQVRAMPGIGSVGLVDRFALGTGVSVTEVVSTGDPVQVSMFKAMPGYLETIGAALGAGRLPTDEDVAAGVRGAVINESAARMIFSSEPAVGREFRTLGAASDPWTVIGVIADFRHGGPRSAYSPQVFFPFDPVQGDLGDGKMVLIRPRGATPDLFGRLRRTAQAIGPRVLVERVRTADELFGLHVVTPRRRTILLSLLGGLGLVLAIVGVFGMTAYAVGRRTVEVGVRMACGGRPGQMVWMMVRDAANPIAVGTAAGLGGALLGTRAIESFLFETTPTDPGTFAALALTLVTAGGLAALVPALRAARVDPVAALRAE